MTDAKLAELIAALNRLAAAIETMPRTVTPYPGTVWVGGGGTGGRTG